MLTQIALPRNITTFFIPICRMQSCLRTREHTFFSKTAQSSRSTTMHSASRQRPLPYRLTLLANTVGMNRRSTWLTGWSAHGQAIKRNKHRCTHMVKLVHDILPTTSTWNKYNGGNRKCTLWSEHCDHILRCKHPTRATWRQNFFQEISTYCQQANTCPHIVQLLTAVFCQWFQGEDRPQILLRQYPAEIHHLIRSQQKNGWRHLFQGCFAKAWEEAQKRYHERISPTQQHTQDKYQAGLITKIWDQWYCLWLQRNNNVYGKDEQSRHHAATAEVCRQLHQIYLQQQMMEPQVQRLLLESLESHNQYPLNVSKNWLLMHTTMFTESVRGVKTMAVQGIKSIRSYVNRAMVQEAVT